MRRSGLNTRTTNGEFKLWQNTNYGDSWLADINEEDNKNNLFTMKQMLLIIDGGKSYTQGPLKSIEANMQTFEYLSIAFINTCGK